MTIHIVVPYEGAGRYAPIWAHEEAEIDFRRDSARAARCTLAFAATELRRCLERSLPGAAVTWGDQPQPGAANIILAIDRDAHRGDGFSLAPQAGGVAITGFSRAGLLYGAYELLRLQGWRWHAPGPSGECAPPPADHLILPARAADYTPSYDQGRGFDFEYASMDSAELWLWMARNRMNVCGLRPATAALAAKLGMQPKIGGHIFEAILDPDRPMPSGQTLWQEHPDWYGLPAGGARRKDAALSTQFCVSQPGLIDFLAGEILRRLQGAWQGADRVDIWGFDTWGSTCACPDCRALGNSTDQMLFLLASLRTRIDAARRDGRLDHDVALGGCAYEGTATLAGPARPAPQGLIEAGDRITFYPINRCYAHDLADPDCRVNAVYQSALESWLGGQPRLTLVAAEYYNVSKYEDLPLLFTGRMRADLARYHARGARALTYMHIPMVNWAMRALTQALFAQLAWDVQTDVDAFLAGYFRDWYGEHSAAMRRAYDLIEEAGRDIADWRAWAPGSVLSQLLRWDGRRPGQPLQAAGHLDAPEAVIAAGRRSVELLRAALALVDDCAASEWLRRAEQSRDGAGLTPALNPVQARSADDSRRVEMRLGDDRRLLRYGVDVMSLMADMAAYHESLRTGDARQAEAAWRGVEQAAASLDASFVPIGYEWPGPGLDSKDGLTRSQLREVIHRCRGARLAAPGT